ncbi:putative disease resistance protein RGA4 isoform X2 [Vigna angularis]|uniref:putative disease resistance protein RGA4 isoform X2 n=1 Tax=Phaseolus angularis TaxID=3914 RepID=UPI0022B4486C|nr:putative disease resistance protein RGA4 isoform X2 [Vigna angularis]
MAAEKIAGALVSTFVERTIDNLASRFVDIFRGNKSHKKQLSNLKVKLLAVDVVADDAEQKQFTDPRVRDWLLAAKDAVYDAEDLLEEIDHDAKEVGNPLTSFISFFENKFESRMEKLIEDLEDLATQSHLLGLERGHDFGEGSRSGSKLTSTYLPNDSVIYGRDDDKEFVFNWLTSDIPDNLSILSIVGMGGVGKTTLAQHVFNDPRVDEAKFDVRAWVCVSVESDVFKVSRKILEDVTRSPDHSSDTDMVHRRLKEKLTGKKFLVVLDDVWNETLSNWKEVRKPLLLGAQGSRIVVTTRSKEVASTMFSEERFLKQLQEDDSWELFAKHAFRDDTQPNPECREIGKKIVKKCKGLPLALKAIGSLLYNKSSVSEWDTVFQNEIWEIPKDRCDIVPALALSYVHLPSHLKTCFAYCALFRKDYEFKKEELTQLWMTENFQQHSKTPDETCQQYFNDLLSRSFFQPSGFDETVSIDAYFHGNNSSSFQSLKKLEFSDMKQWEKWECQAVTGAFPNLQILSLKKCPKLKGQLPELLVPLKTLKITRCQQLEAFPPRTLELDLRHCGKLQLDWAPMEWPRMDGHHMTAFFSESDGSHTLDDLEIVEVISDGSIPLTTFPLDSFPTVKRLVLSWLRNLEMISQDQAHHDHLLDLTITRCPKFESLSGNMRVLSLTSLWIEDCPRFKSIPYGGLPSNLENLTIKGCPKFESLPDSVGNLKLLRSLDLSDTAIRKLPENICSLSHLQILELNYCTYLEELPINLHLLTNLCRLEFRFTKVRKVPPGLEKLKNLKVIMSNFNVDLIMESGIQRLGKLNNLYEDLSIGELHDIENPQDAFEADLKNKTHIESLTLGWERTGNSIDSKKAEDVLENLQPSKTLKELSIFNHGENKFPNWLQQTSIWNMVSLELNKCKSCQSLPPLGLLPFLKKLVISGFDQIVNIDADFHGKNSSSFKSLETLYFSDMRQWEKRECKVVTGAYPCLQHLSISFCPKLKGQLPEQLVPLETLHITNCEQLEAFAPRALDLELRHCGKLQLDSAMKRLVMGGHNTEASLLEMVGSNTLEHLDISSSLESMSDDCVFVRTFSLDFFPILRTLNLRGFGNLQKVLQDHAHYHLQDLTIKKCPKFESLSGIMHMLSLKSLWIEDCPRLVSFPDGGLPSNLNDMRLSNCSRLVFSLKGAFGDRSSLESLWIEGMDAECFPGEGLLPLSLTSLTICDCPNLEKLDYKGLYQLSSLRRLTLVSCPNLQCLPEEGLPRSISYLCIGDCPLLEQRCQTEGGEDWEKIAHIQNLNIL